jgi:hypothetical protein
MIPDCPLPIAFLLCRKGATDAAPLPHYLRLEVPTFGPTGTWFFFFERVPMPSDSGVTLHGSLKFKPLAKLPPDPLKNFSLLISDLLDQIG